LNWYVGFVVLKAIDIGGSMVIHTFGAYYGLACSLALSPKNQKHYKYNVSGYNSDVFSMIGTLFLWIMWPSFNCAFAPEYSQARTIINTFLGLIGATLSAFLFSRMFEEEGTRFDMIHIQNATLAGGVAMGACSDLRLDPGGALLIGAVAGFISVFGFVFLSPALTKCIGLRDTCGVHNLHGMPGVLGGIVSIIATAVATRAKYGNAEFEDHFPHLDNQALYQLIALLITLGIAIVSGLVVGVSVQTLSTFFKQRYYQPTLGEDIHFVDETQWLVAADYTTDTLLQNLSENADLTQMARTFSKRSLPKMTDPTRKESA